MLILSKFEGCRIAESKLDPKRTESAVKRANQKYAEHIYGTNKDELCCRHTEPRAFKIVAQAVEIL